MSQSPAVDTISLIDVLWLNGADSSVVAAFEVEHSTSIYSGILRMYDLDLSDAGRSIEGLYLVAPDEREKDIRIQMARPAFQAISNLSVRYLPYSEFENHRGAMARFGEGIKALETVARALP